MKRLDPKNLWDSKHYLDQIRARGFARDAGDVIVRHGAEQKAKGGCIKYVVTRATMWLHVAQCPCLANLVGAYVVVDPVRREFVTIAWKTPVAATSKARGAA